MNITSSDIDNQHEYWDKVADQKTFSHPLNFELLKKYITKAGSIADFGCGYGRIVKELLLAGFSNTNGYDISSQLVRSGVPINLLLQYIYSPQHLPVENNSVDCILLFAVLTCIPSNNEQIELIRLLHSKLKPGGILYISDYYLQYNEISKSRYTYFINDPENFGVFTLLEGALLRHHTNQWIDFLIKDFEVMEERLIEVKTMNGNSAKAFQLIARK